jgi:ribA/ribD-fused uncharacterized protein
MATQTIGPFRGTWAFLSNFYPAPVMFEGDVYPTVEHAYQAAKTTNHALRQRIRQCVTPGHAKAAGRQLPLQPDWEQVKLAVMEALIREKFMRHPELAKQLRTTSPHTLVELNSWGDRFWGVCRGRGRNHLGRILMAVRDALRATDERTHAIHAGK